MPILIQSATIIDSSSTHHLQKRDVLIEKGKIQQIAKKIKANNDWKVISKKDIHISPAWIDLSFQMFDPGFEYRENFESATYAAAKAGFAAICVMPNSNPPMDNKAKVAYLLGKNQKSLCKVLPVGAVSQGVKGKDLAEIYDMYESGAVAFSDGKQAIQDAGLMERALLYVKKMNAIIINQANEETLSNHGQINEGQMSTQLGLEGVPAIAEELMIARDLFLAEHTNSRLHISGVSTRKSIELIKKAKKKGIQVTCDVHIANLYFNEEVLAHYDTNYKVKPPLRSKKDQKAIIKGLKNGDIDAIASGHFPLHEDEKKVEFGNALFGMSTIDFVYQAANTILGNEMSQVEIVEKLNKAYTILGIEKPSIGAGEKASITLFSPSQNEENPQIYSLGKNSGFINEELKGSVYGIIHDLKTNLI